MLGVYLIICLTVYIFIELKTYYILKDDSIETVELDSEVRTYELCTPACKLNTISSIVILIGYLGCMLPYLFIDGIETKAYITYIVMLGVSPIAIIAYLCYLNNKNSHGYINVSLDIIEYIRHKSFSIQVCDIKKITSPAFDCYQIHFKEEAKKKALNINIRSFYKKKEIHSLMKQLRNHIAQKSGQDKGFTRKISSFPWMFERLGFAYIGFMKILVLLILFYTSYCCIDYDFFGKDYTAEYNVLNADNTQSENAWDHYVQAAVNYVKLDKDLQKTLNNITDPNQLKLTNDQKGILKKWLDDSTSAWDSLKKAVSIGYCNATYEDIAFLDYTDRDDFSSPNDTGYSQIKYLYSYSNTARLVGMLDIDWFELFEMQLASSKHFVHGKSFIDQLVGYAMLHRAIKVFARNDSYELQDLQKVETALTEYFPNGVPSFNIEGEILISCSLFEDMINRFDIPIQTPLNPTFVVFGSIGGAEGHVRKRYKSVLEDAQNGIEVEPENCSFISFPIARNMLISIVEPSLSSVYKISQRTETTLSAGYVIIDLEKYYLMKGSYPVDIQQLKNVGLTSELPKDSDTDSSIIYSNDGERAVLYAVGRNGKDDGGYKDRKKSDGKRDDIIFWKREIKE